MSQCTAKSKRSQKRCKRNAVPGKDKCRMHGGATPIKHGLRSKYQPAVLMARIEEMRNSEKLTDLKNMLAVQHILLGIALENLQEAESNPEVISALLNNVQSITETISKNIERHRKMTDSDGKSAGDLFTESFTQFQESLKRKKTGTG